MFEFNGHAQLSECCSARVDGSPPHPRVLGDTHASSARIFRRQKNNLTETNFF